MKKYVFFFPILSLFLLTCVFFYQVILQGKIPIAADTVVGLYHPFRDFYASDYPNGIPFKNFLVTDPVRQQYPWRQLAVEELKHFSLPLWNPYQGTGSPLLANFQSGIFYPLNIFFFLLPFSTAWSMLVFLQVFLGAFFMYLYLKYLRLHTVAAMLGGISFALSGFFIAWLEWNTIAQTMLWVPLVLLATERFLQSRNKKWLVISLASECSLIFAGHIQTAFYALIVINLYLLARLYQMKSGSSVRGKVTHFLRSVRPFLIIGLIVALITSIQWLPTLQFIMHSARQADQMDWHVEGWFLPWQHLIQFIAPDFFGNPSTLNYWGVWNYGELVGYVGIFPLVMAVYAIIFRRDKKTAFFATLFFISLLFSLPTFFAKLPFLLSLPFLATAQPTRLLAVTTLSLAVLSGLGVDLYMKKKRAIFYPLFLVAVCLSGLWVVATFFYAFFGISPDNALTARSNLKLPSILFATVLVLLSIDILSKKKWLQQGVLVILLLITSVDLVRFGWKYTPFANSEYLYPSTKVISLLTSDNTLFRVMATDSRLFPPNFSSIYKIYSVDLYDPLYLIRFGELIAAMERNEPNISPPFGFNRIITPHAISSPLVNLLNVKYVLSFNDISSDRFRKLGQEGSTMIFENKDVLPRAFFAKTVIPAISDQDAVTKLFQNSNNFKRVAVVENWNPSKNTTFSQGNISEVIYKENSVTLKVQNRDEAFLVLLDADYPSWKATIQTGNSIVKTQIYSTDLSFRGVVVPKGVHTIVFSIGII